MDGLRGLRTDCGRSSKADRRERFIYRYEFRISVVSWDK